MVATITARRWWVLFMMLTLTMMFAICVLLVDDASGLVR